MKKRKKLLSIIVLSLVICTMMLSTFTSFAAVDDDGILSFDFAQTTEQMDIATAKGSLILPSTKYGGPYNVSLTEKPIRGYIDFTNPEPFDNYLSLNFLRLGDYGTPQFTIDVDVYDETDTRVVGFRLEHTDLERKENCLYFRESTYTRYPNEGTLVSDYIEHSHITRTGHSLNNLFIGLSVNVDKQVTFTYGTGGRYVSSNTDYFTNHVYPTISVPDTGANLSYVEWKVSLTNSPLYNLYEDKYTATESASFISFNSMKFPFTQGVNYKNYIKKVYSAKSGLLEFLMRIKPLFPGIYSQDEYDTAVDNAYDEGHEDGYLEGYGVGYETGAADAGSGGTYEQGYEIGYREGFSGATDTYAPQINALQSRVDGLLEENKTIYDKGLEDGYDTGHDDGYTVGYYEGTDHGYEKGLDDSDAFVEAFDRTGKYLFDSINVFTTSSDTIFGVNLMSAICTFAAVVILWTYVRRIF